MTLHPLERLIHLLKHLLGGDPELAELGAQLLHGELGLEVFRQLEALHEHPVALHQLFHRVDELLLALPVELAVVRAQLHQLLVVAEQPLGLLLNDVRVEERHDPSMHCGDSGQFELAITVRIHAP